MAKKGEVHVKVSGEFCPNLLDRFVRLTADILDAGDFYTCAVEGKPDRYGCVDFESWEAQARELMDQYFELQEK